MIDIECLKEYLVNKQNAANCNVGFEELVDLNNVTICGSTENKKVISFLEQIGNPYYYKVGSTPVKVSFENNAQPLDEKLKSFFINLKCYVSFQGL